MKDKKYNGSDVKRIYKAFGVLPTSKHKENCSWVYEYAPGFNDKTGNIDPPKPPKKDEK